MNITLLEGMQEVSYEDSLNINGGDIFRGAGRELGRIFGHVVNFIEEAIENADTNGAISVGSTGAMV